MPLAQFMHICQNQDLLDCSCTGGFPPVAVALNSFRKPGLSGLAKASPAAVTPERP